MEQMERCQVPADERSWENSADQIMATIPLQWNPAFQCSIQTCSNDGYNLVKLKAQTSNITYKKKKKILGELNQ